MKKNILIALILGFMTVLLCSCGRREAPAAGAGPLHCYVGGTMRPVMERLAAMYREKTGCEVLVDYAGSGELVIKLEQTGRGDLIVVHDPFAAYLMNRKLGARTWVAASLDPVIVVAKGNPKGIKGFRDLAGGGIRIVQSHQIYSTAGHIVERMAAIQGITGSLNSNIVSRTKGGGDAANAVIMGSSDASIVWNAVAKAREDKLDVVMLEDDVKLREGIDAVTTATYGVIDMDYVRVTITRLACSEQQELADDFAEFVASEANRDIWRQYGFSGTHPERDTMFAPAAAGSQRIPRLLVYCAAGMRKPVNEMADEYQAGGAAAIEITYDGSNRLLGQVKLTGKGDIYIAGDAEYIDMAAESGLVESRATICHFVPVIMVRKGNPLGIKDLSGLLADGLKIGQGDPRAAAIGRLMPAILAKNGINEADWEKNVVMRTPTVNELGIGMKLDTLDAAIVWDATAKNYADSGDIIPIAPERNICPTVEAAVLRHSTEKAAASAFLAFMVSGRGREILERNGYTVDKP